MYLRGKEYNFKVEEEFLKSMGGYMSGLVSDLKSRISNRDISAYAETRMMPPGAPRPGRWENKFTPYLVEPMFNMSPQSPVQREIILKAAQGGWTAMAENILCYYMGEMPADILFMSAGDDVLERWATRRLEYAIDSFDIRDKLVVGHDSGGKSRRSADKMFSKDYIGGRLDMSSARSASKQRATDKRILIRDEIDGVPAKLTTGEGYWLDVSWARTKAWGRRRKVLDFGTPTTFEKSEVWKAYQHGDQRKFLVPCPHCGTFQELQFGTDKSQHGVKPVREGGVLIDAVYMCEHCHDAFYNSDKISILRDGYWEPTAKTSEKHWVSRHWSSCYSPFMTLYELYAEYERAKEKPDGMRSFVNLNEGMPYKEQGVRMSVSRLVSLKGSYVEGTVPEGTIFTTVGLDVQEGSVTDKSNPPRIEFEICGHGLGYRTYSLMYKRIEGKVDNAFAGAWQELYEFIAEGGLKLENKMGVVFSPKRLLLDSGAKTGTVYQFAERLKYTFACKGMGNNFKPDETVDKRNTKSDRYKRSKGAGGTPLYIISTNDYKRILRAALKIQRPDRGESPKMLCEFPINYDTRYFDMLNAEELLEDGSFDSGGRPNEAVDCRVYNMCAAESWLNDTVNATRDYFRKTGRSEREVLAINKEVILLKLEKELTRLKT